MPQIGETISSEQFNQLYPVGTTLSGEEFGRQYGQGIPSPATEQQPTGKINFLQRLKLGFGGAEATKKSEALEQQAGLAGKFDVGDIADVAGRSLPFIGGMLGGAGGAIAGMGVGAVPGVAIGAVAGESVKQAIGRGLGIREEVPLTQEMKDIAFTGGGALAGGKIMQTGLRLIKPVFSRIVGLLTSESADNITMVLDNPKVADTMYREGDAALRKIAIEGSKKSVSIKNNWYKAIAETYDNLLGKFKKPITSSQQLKTEFTDFLDTQSDDVTAKIEANPGEILRINDAYKAISKWKDFTVGGIRKLRQVVGEYTSFPDVYGKPAKSPFLSQYYHSLNDKISSSLPKDHADVFKEMNKFVTSYSDSYDNLVKAFNSGDPFSKLASALSKNKDTLRQTLKLYEKVSGKKIFPLLAAREISAVKPAQFFLNPRAIIDAFISPRVQLGGIIKAGQISELAGKVGTSLYKKFQTIIPKTIIK